MARDPAGIVIRRAVAADVDGVYAMAHALTREVAGASVASSLAEQLRADVEAALRGDPDDLMLVAERDGQLVASGRGRVLPFHPMFRFGADPRHVYVELMYAAPEVRGAGVAAKILAELEAWAASRGVGHVTLHHSPKARSFYERHGYAPLGELHKRISTRSRR